MSLLEERYNFSFPGWTGVHELVDALTHAGRIAEGLTVLEGIDVVVT